MRPFPIFLMLSIILAGCTREEPQVPPRPPVQLVKQPPNRALAIARSLRRNLSEQQLTEELGEFLGEIRRAGVGDMDDVRTAVSILRRQPRAVRALVKKYNELPETAYSQRRSLVQVISELRREDALQFLQETATFPLPPPGKGPHASPRDHAEMLQTEAAIGLAYMRREEADAQLLDVIRTHESKLVRIQAIDAYLWNHNDTDEAIQYLTSRLPEDLHKYIGLPRFAKGMDAYEFSMKVKEWREKWGGTKP